MILSRKQSEKVKGVPANGNSIRSRNAKRLHSQRTPGSTVRQGWREGGRAGSRAGLKARSFGGG